MALLFHTIYLMYKKHTDLLGSERKTSLDYKEWEGDWNKDWKDKQTPGYAEGCRE